MKQASELKQIIPTVFLSFWLANVLHAQQVAFPGAEGYGKYTVGGRGGSVYEVTTLNPTGPGSLGAAISASGPRTVVFKVSGTIEGNFNIRNDRITIAGQTAPGDGICIKGSLGVSADDVNVRYLRVRPNSYGIETDSIGGRYNNNIIVDHVSASWSSDEVMSFYVNHDVTIQWSMISEANAKILNGDNQGHRFGGIWGNDNGTYHHNLFAHNDSRNPRWASGAMNNDFRDNVLYNWGYQSIYGGEDYGDSTWDSFTVNMVANYYKPGPATGSGVRDRIAEPSARTGKPDTDGNGNDKGDWYVAGNVVEGSAAVTANNWLGVDGSNYVQLSQPWNSMPINEQSAADAYESVLDGVGASLHRDSVDSRIINEVRTGTATYGNNGIITTPSDVGGWPTLNGAPAPADNDHDGMPSEWELRHGLNPNLASDRNNDFDSDGYTNLEDYLNDVGAFPAVTPLEFNGGTSNRFAQYQNWAFQWQPSRFDTAIINNGTVVVDAVGQHAGNLVLGTNPGDNVTLNITSGWIEVEDAPTGLSDGITAIGDDPAATATLNLSGGKLTTKVLLKGDGSTFNFTGGTLGAEMVGFDLVNDGGTIAPGSSPGMTHVMGELTINSGSLQIELGGTGTGEFDQLVIDGPAALGGSLDVSLLNGFSLEPNSIFEILDVAGATTGEFAGLGEGALVGNFGEDLFITYAAGDGNDVALYTAVSGDVDHDGDVDGQDFLLWQRNPSIGDLADWQEHYGNAAAASNAAVPEPASICLLAALVSVGCVRRYCRRANYPT